MNRLLAEVQRKEQNKEDPHNFRGVQCCSVSLFLDQPSWCHVCEGHRSWSVWVMAVSLSSGSRTRHTKLVSLISCLPPFQRYLSLLSGISWVPLFLSTLPHQLSSQPPDPSSATLAAWRQRMDPTTVHQAWPAGLHERARASCCMPEWPPAAPGVLSLPLQTFDYVHHPRPMSRNSSGHQRA